MRLIDADALKDKLDKKARNDFCLDDEYETILATLMSVEDMIDNAPTIDAVEVVRCKDCEHYIAERYTRSAIRPTAAFHETNICLRWDFDGAQTSPDGYCSYGERREESENK